MFAGTMLSTVAPFQAFLPWVHVSTTAMKVAAAANAAVVILIASGAIIAGIFWIRGSRDNGVLLAAALVCLACAVFSGREFSRAFLGERFVFPAIFLASAWAASSTPLRNQGRGTLAAAAIACVLLMAQAAYLRTMVAPVSGKLADTLAELRQAPTPSDFQRECAALNDSSWRLADRTALDKFLPNNPVGIRLLYYGCIGRDTDVAIWPYGMVRYSGRGNPYDQCTWQTCL